LETPCFTCGVCGKSFTSMRRLTGHRIGKHVRKLGLKNSTIQTEGLSEAQKGYLAGFLDGEGGIQITRSERSGREYTLALHPTVYFTNTHVGFPKHPEGVAWLRLDVATARASWSERHLRSEHLRHAEREETLGVPSPISHNQGEPGRSDDRVLQEQAIALSQRRQKVFRRGAKTLYGAQGAQSQRRSKPYQPTVV
jgi:hypothetical protein